MAINAFLHTDLHLSDYIQPLSSVIIRGPDWNVIRVISDRKRQLRQSRKPLLS